MNEWNKLRSHEIRAALKRRYPSPECGIVFEVAQGTGHQAARHLDAVAMELWPSRGLALHGIEIKVDLYDWRREKANPEKAEQIARFCDYFWIAAPAGVVPQDELPSAWGLLEVMPDDGVTQTKPAFKTDAQPVDRAFLAAILRAASRMESGLVEALIAKERQDLEKTFELRLTQKAEALAERRGDDSKCWRDLIEALGGSPGEFWHDREMIAAVKAVMKSGVTDTYGGLASILTTLDGATARLRDAGVHAGIEIATKDTLADRVRRRRKRPAA